MPLGDLLAALERDANAEMRATTAATDTEIARITVEAARERADRLALAVHEITAREEAAAQLRLAAAARDHRRATLVARAAMLARVQTSVRAALPALVDAALRARFVRAAAAYGDGACRDTPTGVVIDLADGTRIDATLDAALDRAWPRLASEAVVLADQEGA